MIFEFVKHLIKNRRIPGRAFALLFSVILLTSCGSISPESETALVMDTVFNVTVYGEPSMPGELIGAAEALDEKVLSRFSEDSLLSGYSESRTQLENDEQYDGAYDASENLSDSETAGWTEEISGITIDLEDILEKCDELNTSSCGAFDISIGALSDLWDIKGNMEADHPSIPMPAQVEAASGDRSVMDLGAVGKGIYLDLAYEMLASSGAKGAVISAGGSILVYGEKPDGADFKVGIKNPFPDGDGTSYGIIITKGGYFISTSGSYERYFEYGGEIYHHIIDPVSGYPAWTEDDILNRERIQPELRSSQPVIPESVPVSVTVISRSGFYSDALSTACFVLGPEQGMMLAERYDSDVIYIMSDGKFIASHGIICDEGSREYRLSE